jgi:hypothetical protein
MNLKNTVPFVVELELPSLPLTLKIKGRNEKVDVGALSEEKVREVANAWCEVFIAHCAQRATNLFKPTEAVIYRSIAGSN